MTKQASSSELISGDTSYPSDALVRLTLDSESFDGLLLVIDSPPAPGPKLKALLCRVPVWEKET